MAGGNILPPLAGVPRLPDAADRLRAFVAARALLPFSWGANDCCLFAADAVHAMLGVDAGARLRGYASALQAERVLRAYGGPEGIARQVLGEPLPAPLLACSGDIGLIEQDRPMLAVCMGEWWALPSRAGLGMLPLDSARLAWKVGCG